MMEKINKDKIISAAEELIRSRNSTEITLTDIANELSITHSALYKHFKNKSELWESITIKWFKENIISQIKLKESYSNNIDELHDWIEQFINAKRHVYMSNPNMFKLNTKYVDNNPKVLHNVLSLAYPQINKILNLNDDHKFMNAETIMSAFAIFTLPEFIGNLDDKEQKEQFERIWEMIVPWLCRLNNKDE